MLPWANPGVLLITPGFFTITWVGSWIIIIVHHGSVLWVSWESWLGQIRSADPFSIIEGWRGCGRHSWACVRALSDTHFSAISTWEELSFIDITRVMLQFRDHILRQLLDRGCRITSLMIGHTLVSGSYALMINPRRPWWLSA